MSGPDTVDLFVIGGGINGAGIARDAAGRGLSVVLCEKDDLAQGTSSRSGKLVHGGLRYLEYLEFRLVREALIEREVLLRCAPHIIWPLRFVLPHSPLDRPAWLVRLGLFLYDHLGGRENLPGTRTLDLSTASQGDPIRNEFRTAFEFSDCWVDDARLVILNALDAYQRGAVIHTRTACISAHRAGRTWQIEMKHQDSGVTSRLHARALINAAGPWVNDVIARVAGGTSGRNVRLVKGSHIVVPKFWDGTHAYLVQNVDKRVIFINPYEGGKALIGTTDIAYSGRPEDVYASEDEIIYLIDAVNRYFKRQLSRSDVVHAFAGVRPLYDDNADNPSAVSRDYIFDFDAPDDAPPMLSVFGGKITTFRKLAEHAMGRLRPSFPSMGNDWTKSAVLPGGDISKAGFERFQQDLSARYAFLPAPVMQHYARLYGTRALELLANVGSLSDLGCQFAPTFYECEALYLIKQEWARSVDDIVERRTKHGLAMTAENMRVFADWFAGVVARAG